MIKVIADIIFHDFVLKIIPQIALKCFYSFDHSINFKVSEKRLKLRGAIPDSYTYESELSQVVQGSHGRRHSY